MHRFVGGLVAALLLGGAVAATPAAAQQNTGVKIAFLNSRAVLEATPGYAKAESTYTREVEGYRQEVGKLQAQLDSAAAEFDQQSVMLSPTARANRRRELEAQRDRLEQRAAELNERRAQRERELLEPIQNRVSTVIDGIRAEGNYSMIFDIAASGGMIVSADKSLDITQRVIQRLQTSK